MDKPMQRKSSCFDDVHGEDLQAALNAGLARGGEFAEVFREKTRTSFLRYEEQIARSLQSGVDAGAGVRVLHGGRTGYASTEETGPESLLSAAAAARGIVGAVTAQSPIHATALSRASAESDEDGACDLPLERRLEMARQLDSAARAADARVRQVIVTISCRERSIQVANSEGLLVSESRNMTGVTILVVVESAGRRERGSFAASGRPGDSWLGVDAPRKMAEEAVRRGLVLLDAVEAPAGQKEVVIGNGWGGVLLHEAVGHGFEADFVRRGTSVFCGREGQMVASPLCTVTDDGSLPGLRGTAAIDDEGVPTRPTVLIEKGRITGFLHDRLSARLLRARPTGNGRRESYRSPPIPRQTNLYMASGNDDPADIIRGVRDGFYARQIGGGQVDITSGSFVFQVTEGYLIEQGRVTAPVRNANLIGVGHEVLKRVTRVGSDLAFDDGQGTCGKEGQSVPVGVGQPTLLISSLTVGGTRT